MPEIKNNFLHGKMNKDLHERLIPNGQYRNAENVEVSTAEDSSVGTVKNILGNKRVEDIVPVGFKCVGSIANEKTNKIYWFVSKINPPATCIKDAIIDGNSTKAVRFIEDFNRTYGSENPITYENYNSDAITERVINKIKKRLNP